MRRMIIMNIKIKEYEAKDALAASCIWNQVVDDGIAFPQEDIIPHYYVL